MSKSRNTARCGAGHAIKKPNLVWELLRLDRYPSTPTELRTLRRWVPRCRACADPDLLLQQEWLNDFTLTKGTEAYDDELARLTALDRRRAAREGARWPQPSQRPQEPREGAGGRERHAEHARDPGASPVASQDALDRLMGWTS